MRHKTSATIILLSMVVLSIASVSQGGSIWAKRDKNMRDLYTDDVARQIGDILTVMITEESTVDNKATRTLEKKTSRDADFNGKVGVEHIIPSIPAVNLGTGTEFTNKLDGKADYKDERKFADSMTVVVIDIMPNGNLVVMGTRERTIAGDTQKIQISGIVRPSDIAFNNTVASQSIADFRLITQNSGVAAPYMRTNWLGGIFDVVWPF